MTVIFVLHVIALMFVLLLLSIWRVTKVSILGHKPSRPTRYTTRSGVSIITVSFPITSLLKLLQDDLFLVVTAIYLIDIVVRLYGLGWNSYRANGWNLFDILVAVGSLTTTLMVRAGSSGFAIEQLQKLFITSIAFKLVQRTNSLNKLFKTAV